MARISERRPGREDGGFTRTFGDAGLGALLSMTHATSISAGTELEKQIQSLHANLMTAEQLGQFLKNALPNGKYVMAKDLIRKHLKPIINSSHEPDFIVIVVDGEKVFVVEVKDGDAFDTKKAAGEVASVRAFAASLHSFLLGINLAYSVEAKICCFNQEDKDRIVAGLKGRITRREAMTGREFYRLTETLLDASLCGVPQRRIRLIVVGVLDGEPGELLPFLQKRLSPKPRTMREHFGTSLGTEYYYRHPRNYSRRAIYGLDEPSATIRGVNRPIAPNYPGHPLDAAPKSLARPLTAKERALTQSFPASYRWAGNKTAVEQMIGNAVPPNLGMVVGQALKEWMGQRAGQ